MNKLIAKLAVLLLIINMGIFFVESIFAARVTSHTSIDFATPEAAAEGMHNAVNSVFYTTLQDNYKGHLLLIVLINIICSWLYRRKTQGKLTSGTLIYWLMSILFIAYVVFITNPFGIISLYSMIFTLITFGITIIIYLGMKPIFEVISKYSKKSKRDD
jgi:hypothetical protein